MPVCFGCFDYGDDYCYDDCPYSYSCEEESDYGCSGYYGDYCDNYSDSWW